MMTCPRCSAPLEAWRAPRAGSWSYLHGLSNACELSLARWGGAPTREALDAPCAALALHRARPEYIALVSQHIDRYRCEVSPLAVLEKEVRRLAAEVRQAMADALEHIVQ